MLKPSTIQAAQAGKPEADPFDLLCHCSMPSELSTLNFQPSTRLSGPDQLRNAVNQLQSLLYAV